MITLKKNGSKNPYFLALASALICFLLWLSCSIDNFYIGQKQVLPTTENDLIARIFGQLRQDIAAFFYLKADCYFHSGTHHDKGDEHSCKEKAPFSSTANTTKLKTPHNNKYDVFSRINKAIKFRPVRHLEDHENAEIMPWFEISTRLDPHFEKAYLDGSYWLSIKMNQPDKGLKFLRRGLKYNPRSWKITAQMGNIYFITKKNYSKAYTYFKHAYLLMEKQSCAAFDKKQVLRFLSASAQKANKHQDHIYYKNKLSEL